MAKTDLPIITRSRLVSDLSKLGIVPGDTLMLHASVKAVGWIVGGPDMVIQAILDVIGPAGTLMMYIKCEEPLNEIGDWPEDWQKAYLAECPPFDPNRNTRPSASGVSSPSTCEHGPARIAATIPKQEWRQLAQKRSGSHQIIPSSLVMAQVPHSQSCVKSEGEYYCLDHSLIA